MPRPFGQSPLRSPEKVDPEDKEAVDDSLVQEAQEVHVEPEAAAEMPQPSDPPSELETAPQQEHMKEEPKKVRGRDWMGLLTVFCSQWLLAASWAAGVFAPWKDESPTSQPKLSSWLTDMR